MNRYIRKLMSVLLFGQAILLCVSIFVYSFFHPELTQMEVLRMHWHYYVMAMVLLFLSQVQIHPRV